MNERLKKIAVLFGGTVINLLLGLVTTPIITHIISPSDYGLVSLLETYTNVLVTICLLGLDQAYLRFYYEKTSDGYHKELMKAVLKVPIALSVIVGFFVIFMGQKVIDCSQNILGLVAVSILVTMVERITRSTARLEQDSKLYSVLLIVHRVLYASIIIVLVLLFDFSPVWSMLLGGLFSILPLVIIVVISKKNIFFNKNITDRDTVRTTDLLQYSYPFVFTSIVGWVFTASDKLVLQYCSTHTEIGYYAAAGSIVSLITIIQTTFSTLWIPIAVETFEKNKENTLFFKKSLNIMVVILFCFCSTLVLFKDVFSWILGENYEQAKFIFPCLLFNPIMHTLSEITVYGVNFYKKTHWHIFISSVSCTFNLMLNFLLIPMFGAKGAAISTGFAYVLFFIIRSVIGCRYYKVKFDFFKVGVIGIAVFSFCLYNSFYKTNVLSLLMYIAILISLFVLYKNTTKEILVIGKAFFIGIMNKTKKR